MENLLKNKKTCPEETIYQIGTVEESVSPEILLQVANDFFGEMESRFGTHVHILNEKLSEIGRKYGFSGKICYET